MIRNIGKYCLFCCWMAAWLEMVLLLCIQNQPRGLWKRRGGCYSDGWSLANQLHFHRVMVTDSQCLRETDNKVIMKKKIAMCSYMGASVYAGKEG